MNKPTEVNDVPVLSIGKVVGQDATVEQVTVALDACQMDGKKFDHSLLVSGPGLGKSMIAQIISAEMAVPCQEILGQSVTSISDLNAILLQASDKSIVFIDECHEMRKDFQTALYLALDKQTIFVNGGKTVQPIPIADFTLLLATTDEYCLLAPLRDRMKLTLRLQFYSIEDLTLLLRHRILALGWEVEDGVLADIAKRGRGTPRLALRILSACRRVCRSEGEETLTHAHLRRACVLEQLDDLGLGPTEQQYLRLLADGPMRLNVIASALGLPARTVSQVTESFLIRANLIGKDSQSRRYVTKTGHDHLSNSRSQTE
jgi:Holliday junction DNA helicase RuvB